MKRMIFVCPLKQWEPPANRALYHSDHFVKVVDEIHSWYLNLGKVEVWHHQRTTDSEADIVRVRTQTEFLASILNVRSHEVHVLVGDGWKDFHTVDSTTNTCVVVTDWDDIRSWAIWEHFNLPDLTPSKFVGIIIDPTRENDEVTILHGNTLTERALSAATK